MGRSAKDTSSWVEAVTAERECGSSRQRMSSIQALPLSAAIRKWDLLRVRALQDPDFPTAGFAPANKLAILLLLMAS